jgi:putative MATE family efflux protein
MEKTIELMERTPVWRVILKLGIPTMLSMIVQGIYNITDTFFIGMLGDPDLVAGISLALPLFMMTQGIGSLFAVGSASYISRKMGERQYDEARHTSSVTFYTTFVIGGLMTVLMYLFKDPILRLIGTSSNTFEPTDDYFSIICLFSIFMIQNISLQGLVRSEGAATKAMVGMIVGIVLNIVLDPLFIIYFGWGVKGAAWATIIGAVVSCAYFMVFIMSPKSMLSLKFSDMKPNRYMFAEILKIGLPMGLMHIVMSASGAINNIFAVSYGDYVVAAQGINMRICSLSFSMVMGLSQGFQPFAGYNYGSKDYDRLKSGLKITILYSTGLAIVFSAFFLIFGDELIRLFINDKDTVNAGAKLLRAFVFGMPFLGIQGTLMTTFQALGRPIRSLIITLGRSFAIFLPLIFLLNHFFGFSGYVFTQPASDVITTLLSVVFAVTLFNELYRNKK